VRIETFLKKYRKRHKKDKLMMRKGLLFIAFSIVIGSNYVRAQNFKSGTISMQGGIEFGGNYGLSQYTSHSLAGAVSVDYGLPIKLDDGCLGFGLYYGTKSFEEDKQYPMVGGYYFNRKWNFNVYGARFSYHYDLFPVKGLDTYVGLMANYNQVKFTYVDTYYDENPKAKGNPYPLTFQSTMRYTGFVGASYNISNIVGVFGEFALGNYAEFVGINIKL
jgi:hypothetical protein